MAKRQNIKIIKILVKNYLKYLEDNCAIKIKQAYLYGSYAKNKEHEFSDIDVAIVSNQFKGNRFDDMKKIYKHIKNFDVRIEPMPLNDKDFNEGNPFIDEIKKTGIKII